jgi:hypothetical protein
LQRPQSVYTLQKELGQKPTPPIPAAPTNRFGSLLSKLRASVGKSGKEAQ